MLDLDFDELGKELAATFSNDERLLGSKVGGWLKQRHPEIDFAAEGGLRNFIATHLSSVLAWHSKDEKSKVDDRYRLVGAKLPQSEESSTLSPGHRDITGQDIVWDAFVNPKSPYKGRLTLDGGTLQIRDNDSPAASTLPIPSVTREEEREIYAKFVSSEQSAGIVKLRLAMEEADYQKAWYLALRDPALSGVNRGWGKFRFDSLIEIFKTRLAEAELPESDRIAIVDQLVAAYEAGRTRKTKVQITAGAGSTPSKTALAAFARAAISEMSDSELMQLWVPLHAALKAASKPR